MKRFLFISFLFCSVIVLFPGCSGGSSNGEGTIEYEAEILNKDHPMAFVAPSKMTFQFKNSVCRGELSAAMGMFTTVIVSDPEKRNVTQLVRLVHTKIAHVFPEQDMKKQNEKIYPPFKIEKTEEIKEIAGYKCKKAKIIFDGGKHENFDVYYTNDVKIKDPNWSSPFHDIEGVLMEYQMLKYGMELRFTAKSIDEKPVKGSSFDVPKDYKMVPEKEIDALFKSFE